MRKAVCYIRVSREDENPENQLFAIQKWAEEHGYEIVPFMDYAVSGAVDPFQRPGFRMMVSYMKSDGVRTIVVAELERLTRDVEHYEKLKDLKKIIGWAIEEDVEIISIADYKFTEIVNDIKRTVAEFRRTLPKEARYLKPIYDLVASLLISVAEKLPELRIAIAQAERERVAERTKRALQRLKAEGKVYTKPTFLHWLALYRSGKERLRDLVPDDLADAERYFVDQYVKPYREGVPAMRLYRKFLQQERPVIEMIRRRRHEEVASRRRKGLPVPKVLHLYSSYASFYRLLRALEKRHP